MTITGDRERQRTRIGDGKETGLSPQKETANGARICGARNKELAATGKGNRDGDGDESIGWRWIWFWFHLSGWSFFPALLLFSFYRVEYFCFPIFSFCSAYRVPFGVFVFFFIVNQRSKQMQSNDLRLLTVSCVLYLRFVLFFIRVQW